MPMQRRLSRDLPRKRWPPDQPFHLTVFYYSAHAPYVGRSDFVEELSGQILGASIKVHKKLGTGFAEKIYESALEYV